MSLDFQLGGIKDWETVCRDEERKIRPETQSVIFATITAGIGHITEDRAIEFYLRVQAADALSLWPKGEEITLEQVRKHIGLRTNVIFEPRTSWTKRIFESTEREIKYRERRDREEKMARAVIE